MRNAQTPPRILRAFVLSWTFAWSCGTKAVSIDLTPPPELKPASAIVATEASTGGAFELKAISAEDLLAPGTLDLSAHELELDGDSAARVTVMFFDRTLGRLGGITASGPIPEPSGPSRRLVDLETLRTLSATFEDGAVSPLTEVTRLEEPLSRRSIPWANLGCARIEGTSIPVPGALGAISTLLPVVVRGQRRALITRTDTRASWMYLVSMEGSIEDITPPGLYPSTGTVAATGPGPTGSWASGPSTVWYASSAGRLSEIDVADPNAVHELARYTAPSVGLPTSRISWIDGNVLPDGTVEIFALELEGRFLRFTRSGTVARWEELDVEPFDRTNFDGRAAVATHENLAISVSAFRQDVFLYDRRSGVTRRVTPNRDTRAGFSGAEWVEGLGFVIASMEGQFFTSPDGTDWRRIEGDPSRTGRNGPDWIAPVEGGFIFGAPVGIVGQFTGEDFCPLPCGDDPECACNIANISIRIGLEVSQSSAGVTEFLAVGTPISPQTPAEIIRVRVR
ncbi:MAG: hypothetical protein HYV07_14905 [Deltaproteobacteria bacterium]|nr:hypothetical protein [Deltaproteobacteria bacterium]